MFGFEHYLSCKFWFAKIFNKFTVYTLDPDEKTSLEFWSLESAYRNGITSLSFKKIKSCTFFFYFYSQRNYCRHSKTCVIDSNASERIIFNSASSQQSKNILQHFQPIPHSLWSSFYRFHFMYNFTTIFSKTFGLLLLLCNFLKAANRAVI